MTEAAFQSKLLRTLRAHPQLRDCYIAKHADRFNAGIPDFSISRNRVTIWYELKVWPNKPTKLQAWVLRQLKDGGALITVKGIEHYITPLEKLTSWLTFEQLVEEIVQRSTF